MNRMTTLGLILLALASSGCATHGVAPVRHAGDCGDLFSNVVTGSNWTESLRREAERNGVDAMATGGATFGFCAMHEGKKPAPNDLPWQQLKERCSADGYDAARQRALCAIRIFVPEFTTLTVDP